MEGVEEEREEPSVARGDEENEEAQRSNTVRCLKKLEREGTRNTMSEAAEVEVNKKEVEKHA